LRSAGTHRRRLLPHARSQSQERNHPGQDLINPRGGDFFLATSGDRNLAIDTRQIFCLVIAALSAVGAAFTTDPTTAHLAESNAVDQTEQQRREERKTLKPGLTRHNQH
jgi:hypothetical protein